MNKPPTFIDPSSNFFGANNVNCEIRVMVDWDGEEYFWGVFGPCVPCRPTLCAVSNRTELEQ